MRSLLAFAPLLVCASVAVLAGGCTPTIPVKPAFGTSALEPYANLPPEFAAFNNYDPRVNALLADQLCATPYVPRVYQTAEAVPGRIVGATGQCRRYELLPPGLRP